MSDNDTRINPMSGIMVPDGTEASEEYRRRKAESAAVAETEPVTETEPAVYAGFFTRVAAFLLDNLLASIIAGSATGLFRLLPFMRERILFHFSGADILMYLAFTAYFVLFTRLMGATPGKKLLKIKVISTEGKLDWWSVIYRETVGRFLNSIAFVGYIFSAFDRERRTFADMLADTRVVYDL